MSVVSFAIIFSHSEGCLFTLLIVSFLVQKLLSLIRFLLFILFPLLWELGHRGSSVIYVRECSAYFSPKNFIVSGLIFRSLIHFKFIFVYHVRKHSSFIILHVVD